MYKAIAVVSLLAAFARAQDAPQKQVQPQHDKRPAASAPATTKGADEKAQQQERGRRMLELAEAQAAGLQGGMRAYAFRQLARTYKSSNQAKALELLENAMTATLDMEDDRQGKDWRAANRTRTMLQQQILQDMVPLAPQRAEELLASVEAGGREPVLNVLLGYYEKNKDVDHGMELVYRIGQEKEIPYQAAGRIMAALPPERSGDLLQLFTVSFASYRDHEHPGVSIGGGDFDTMVLEFWQKLPVELAHQAIDELLKQAEKRDDARISMSSDNGSASFDSLYEYRLFELLPVLQHIDPGQADELLKKNDQMKGVLAKYPEGLGSIAPDVANPNAKSDHKGGMGTSFSISSGGARLMQSQNLEEQQVRKIMAEANEHPDSALAQAAAISSPMLRSELYEAIARAAAKKNPSVARSALDKLLVMLDQIDDLTQLSLLRSAAEIYLQMVETEDAKKVVEHGFKVADKLLAADTNADDPNKALKAYWPSAEAFRSFTRLAGEVSPVWAMAQVGEISDPEMKVLAQTSLAQAWLHVSRGDTIIMSNKKKGGSMMMGSDEREQ